MSAVIDIQDLWVEARSSGGDFHPIVEGVSVSVHPGEVVALIGESGSGKTTTALSAMAYSKPGCRIVGGSIKLNGRDLLELTPEERRQLRGREAAYVAQSAASAFNPAIRIGDQVIESTIIHNLMPRDEALRQAVEEHFDCPIRAVPGNHDTRRPLMQAFPFFGHGSLDALPRTFEEQSAAAQPDAPPPTRAQFAEVVGGWLLIGLDTLDDATTRQRRGDSPVEGGASGGCFDDEQDEWLRGMLERHSGLPALVFLHHPPLDRIGEGGVWSTGDLFELAGLRAFEVVVGDHATQIKAVCCGHIHAECDPAPDPGRPQRARQCLRQDAVCAGWRARTARRWPAACRCLRHPPPPQPKRISRLQVLRFDGTRMTFLAAVSLCWAATAISGAR